MDARTAGEVLELLNQIKEDQNSLRDSFPKDLPYLWDSLSPYVDQIQNNVTKIKHLIRKDQSL